MLGIRFAIIGIALMVSGCDFVYGVSRDAPLENEISTDCVRRVIEATPGVERTEYKESHDGKGLFHPEPWVYTYSFAGAPESHILGVLQLHKEYDGQFQYHNSLMGLNSKPPQNEIDATRPVMRAMELQLAAQCGASALPIRVQEICRGVTCGPLS